MTETFFLVIDLQVPGRLRLVFPDKEDKIHELSAVWCANRQGEHGKRTKQIDLAGDKSPAYRQTVLGVVEEIHANALEYYLRTHDSTKTWQRMFGEAHGGHPLKASRLDAAELLSVYDKGQCFLSGLSNNLEIGWIDGIPRIVSAAHNPECSRFIEKALRSIPLDVREFAWHRDGGRCTTPKCGSRTYLHFDHLIPRSWNGSNTENNIVLKCRACNLRKSRKLLP